MTRRYYVPPSATVTRYAAGTTVSLPGEEASHAARVMRVREGDEIVIFDGLGNEADAEVVEIDKRSGMIRIGEVRAVSRLPSRELVLLSCLPKPDRAKEMIERLTEIGVTRLVPLVAQRTQREPTPALLDKLRRVVVEACKQSGRNTLMDITSSMRLTDALSDETFSSSGFPLRLVAHPRPNPTPVPVTPITPAAPPEPAAPPKPAAIEDMSHQPRSLLLVGPEGGFADPEIEQAIGAQWEPWDFGDRIYRVETAAVVGAAILLR